MKLIIFTSTCLRTSSGSVPTTLNILDNLSDSFEVTLILVDCLVPGDEKENFDEITINGMLSHPRVHQVKNINEVSVESLRQMGNSAIIAIYNFLGEDGILPAFCALAGIKVLSTSFSSSVLCFNKDWTKRIISSIGISVPNGIALSSDEPEAANMAISFFRECEKKIIIKPATCGASRGCSVCISEEDVKSGLQKAFIFSDDVVCEEFIEGREYTIGFVCSGNSVNILPPVEIVTNRNFFDYFAKYNDKDTKEICPAVTLDSKLLSRVHQAVNRIVKTLKLGSHGRIDFIVSKGEFFVLEINTFPGLMENSLFPKELKAAGLSFREFLLNGITTR